MMKRTCFLLIIVSLVSPVWGQDTHLTDEEGFAQLQQIFESFETVTAGELNPLMFLRGEGRFLFTQTNLGLQAHLLWIEAMRAEMFILLASKVVAMGPASSGNPDDVDKASEAHRVLRRLTDSQNPDEKQEDPGIPDPGEGDGDSGVPAPYEGGCAMVRKPPGRIPRPVRSRFRMTSRAKRIERHFSNELSMVNTQVLGLMESKVFKLESSIGLGDQVGTGSNSVVSYLFTDDLFASNNESPGARIFQLLIEARTTTGEMCYDELEIAMITNGLLPRAGSTGPGLRLPVGPGEDPFGVLNNSFGQLGLSADLQELLDPVAGFIRFFDGSLTAQNFLVRALEAQFLEVLGAEFSGGVTMQIKPLFELVLNQMDLLASQMSLNSTLPPTLQSTVPSSSGCDVQIVFDKSGSSDFEDAGTSIEVETRSYEALAVVDPPGGTVSWSILGGGRISLVEPTEPLLEGSVFNARVRLTEVDLEETFLFDSYILDVKCTVDGNTCYDQTDVSVGFQVPKRGSN